jgi:hypothetical protein
VADQFKRENGIQRFNASLAVGITRSVGTMWCGYAFAVLALVALPQAVHSGGLALVQWISQTFLQLVLLSIIMVGQDVQAKASDKRAEQTYKDAEAVLHEAREIQEAPEGPGRRVGEDHLWARRRTGLSRRGRRYGGFALAPR